MRPASSIWHCNTYKFEPGYRSRRRVSAQSRGAACTATHHKSIIKEAIDRLESKMAINESRGKAKEAAREQGESTWAFSTGRIHSFKTRSVYQEHTLRFVSWARSTYNIRTLEQLDPRANELTSIYLQQHLADGKSPYTLQLERAALRLFFGNHELSTSVAIPRRARTGITRSRGTKAHDQHFQPANWPELVKFLQATGIRRQELRDLRCQDIIQGEGLRIHVVNGKGGLERFVPVLPGHEADVMTVIAGHDPEAVVFERIPKHLDVHSYRREYAQALYLHHAPGRSLPSAIGRLKRADYDCQAAQQVTWALGHQRIDVVLRHYLR